MPGDCDSVADICKSILPQNQLIRIFPSMGISAIKSGDVGAWKVWLAARHLSKGNDGVEIEKVKSLCTKYVTYRTFPRWIKRANEIGLLKTVTNGTRVVITGEKKAALIFGCVVEPNRVEIKIKHILGKNWRAYLWAAQNACITSGPISRVKLQQITGKDKRRQRIWDNKAGVKRIKNIAKTSYSGDMVDGIKEFTKEPYFRLFDKKSGKWIAARRLPDTRTCKEVKVVGGGRSKNINVASAHLAIINCNYSGRGLNCVRIFCDNDRQIKKTLRHIRKSDNYTVKEVYQRARKNTLGGSRMWEQERL